MRSTRNLIRIASVSALLAAGVFGSKSAHAEADTFGIGSGRTGAGTIATSTVVNSYASITAPVTTTATTLTVDDATGFAAGDLILVWQTTGVAAAISGSPLTTDLSVVPTGSFEYARIKSISGTLGATVTLTNPIVSVSGFAANTSQIVKVPEYTTLTISSTITATPWNGSKGGVIAIFANSTVTNNGVISAAQSGFRGGVSLNDTLVNGCAANDGPVVVGLIVPLDFNAAGGGAKKGEGLLPADFSVVTANPSDLANFFTYGRGNITNGGGGGDCSNSGGAGGGHGGIGGSGGETWTGETDALDAPGGGSRAVGGAGGAPLTYSPVSRLAFGGGGGAGEENNSKGTDGAAGGGVVLLRVAALAGTGTISADGATAGNAMNDGAGGGGAGGLIAVFSAGDATCGGLHANGGAGGSCQADHGPGGGGSGGIILLQSGGGTCSAAAAGGASGLDANDAARGANAGATGTPTSVGTGFTPTTCDVAIDHCGGCVINSDCGSVSTCNTTTNECIEPDGGVGISDAGVSDAGSDAGTTADAGSDAGTRDGGSGADGGSGSDAGSGSDGGNSNDAGFGSDGGSSDDGGPHALGGDLGDDGDLEGGGCSTSGSNSDGTGAAFIGLGLVAALAFLRRKKR